MSFLSNKKILITGMLSNRSLAYGIARAMYQQGAELAFTYQHSTVKDRVASLAKEFNSELLFVCDVSDDKQINQVFEDLPWTIFDGIVHSIAFAPDSAWTSPSYVESVTRDNFAKTQDISAYSLSALAKAGKSKLSSTSSILALSYMGSVKAVPGYNVMGVAKASLEASIRYLANDLGSLGIRVNGISAGPHKTIATARSPIIDKSLTHYRTHSPLRRNVTIDEVGNVAAFLSSNLASGITGEITYVDGGYNIISVNTI